MLEKFVKVTVMRVYLCSTITRVSAGKTWSLGWGDDMYRLESPGIFNHMSGSCTAQSCCLSACMWLFRMIWASP